MNFGMNGPVTPFLWRLHKNQIKILISEESPLCDAGAQGGNPQCPSLDPPHIFINMPLLNLSRIVAKGFVTKGKSAGTSLPHHLQFDY